MPIDQEALERARAAWTFRGQRRPAFAHSPGEGQESVWDYPRPPRYVRDPRRIEIHAGPQCLARSDVSIRVLETGSPPTVYLPPDAFDVSLLRPSPRRTLCEWKGDARYWHVQGPDGLVHDALWSYPKAGGDAAVIAGWSAAYPARLRCVVAGEVVRAQAGGFYGGWIASEIVGPFKGEPGTAHWSALALSSGQSSRSRGMADITARRDHQAASMAPDRLCHTENKTPGSAAATGKDLSARAAASRVEAADRLIESATSPRAREQMTFEAVPPGAAPTSTIPTKRSGGSDSARASAQPISGIGPNCKHSPRPMSMTVTTQGGRSDQHPLVSVLVCVRPSPLSSLFDQVGVTIIDDDAIMAAMRQWLERAVIGLNLCPFAKAVYVKHQVRFVVSRARHLDGWLEDLDRELVLLAAADPHAVETTLLIHPTHLPDFLDFNAFLPHAEAAVEEHGLQGVIQIASFHPTFQFEGTEPDDIGNFTNRAPFPTLHLLREASIERAVAAVTDIETLDARNRETLNGLGHTGWQALWRQP